MNRIIIKLSQQKPHVKILLLINLIVLTAVGVFIFTEANIYFNSDSAASNTLAREMIKNNSLMPENWYYSTVIMLWFYNIPIAVMSLFMTNQLLMRSISVLLTLISLIITVIYLNKKVFKSKAYLAVIPFLFTTLSDCYNEMVFAQAAYLPNALVNFLAFAFLAKSIDEDFQIINKKPLVFFTALMLLFNAVTLQTLQAVVLPLIASIIFLYIYKNSAVTIKRFFLNMKKPIILLAVILIPTFISLGVFKYITDIRLPNNHAYNVTMFSDSVNIRDNIDIFIDGFLYMVGISGGVSLFSLGGLQNLIVICVSLCLFLVFPVFQILKFKNERFEIRLYTVYTVIHVLELLIILIFCGVVDYVTCGRYLLTSAFLLTGLSGYYLYESIIGKSDVIKLLTILILSFFVITVNLPKFKALSHYDDDYKAKYGIIDFLKDNNLEYGYATFWNAGIYSVASDFEVQINAVEIINGFVSSYLWLSSSDWYDENNYYGETFLLLNSEEFNELVNIYGIDKILSQPVRTLEFGDFVILVFDYNIASDSFNRKKYNTNILPFMYNSFTSRTFLGEIPVTVVPRQLIYGPYFSLESGSYEVTIDISGDGEAILSVVSDLGNISYATKEIGEGLNICRFSLDSNKDAIEFHIRNISEASITINSIIYRKL